MLQNLVKRLAAGLIATMLMAVAGALALVAIAFAVYALLRDPLTPAGAAAVTAIIFAAVTGLIAIVAPRLVKAGPAPQRGLLPLDPGTMQVGSEVAVALLGFLADMSISRRFNRQEKAQDKKQSRRRRRLLKGENR